MPKPNVGPAYPPGAPLPADFFDAEEEESISLFGVGNIFLRHLRWVVGVPVLAFVVVATASLFADHQYSATSKFMPADGDQLQGGSRGGLMAQLGQLVGGGEGPSSGFYAALLGSGPLAREAARDTYEVVVDGETRRGTVAQLHGMELPTPAADLKASENLIRGNVRSWAETGTGFVGLQVTSEWPELALAVNRRLLELVNEFNVDQRQSRAATERQFVEDRLADADRALEEAERELRQFLETNQRYEESPRLRFEANRLQRRMELRQGLYTSLAQSYEQARINEVRNTPVTTVVDPPEANVRIERGRSPLLMGFIGFVVALLVVSGLILVRAYLSRHSDEHREDYEEFRTLARTTLPSLIPAGIRSRFSPRGGTAPRDNGGPGTGGEGAAAESPDRRPGREVEPVGDR